MPLRFAALFHCLGSLPAVAVFSHCTATAFLSTFSIRHSHTLRSCGCSFVLLLRFTYLAIHYLRFSTCSILSQPQELETESKQVHFRGCPVTFLVNDSFSTYVGLISYWCAVLGVLFRKKLSCTKPDWKTAKVKVFVYQIASLWSAEVESNRK